MYKSLIIKAFKEARLEKEKEGFKKPSQTDISNELSDFIDKREGFRLGERSFRDYYNDAKRLLDSKEDINIKQISVVNGLCKYLGFGNYQDFVQSLVDEEEEESLFKRIKVLIKSNKTIISIISIIIVFFITYNSITRQRWMVWQEDHYVEVKFDLEKYNVNQLKVYKEERIEFFKKINNPTCTYNFFDEDGSVRVWYGKNSEKELECFTSFGLHPETGKTLRPITQYMIDKYLCKN